MVLNWKIKYLIGNWTIGFTFFCKCETIYYFLCTSKNMLISRLGFKFHVFAIYTIKMHVSEQKPKISQSWKSNVRFWHTQNQKWSKPKLLLFTTNHQTHLSLFNSINQQRTNYLFSNVQKKWWKVKCVFVQTMKSQNSKNLVRES